jgi:hypothetical protein
MTQKSLGFQVRAGCDVKRQFMPDNYAPFLAITLTTQSITMFFTWNQHVNQRGPDSGTLIA